MFKIAVVIPAYNEEKSIADVVNSIHQINIGAEFIKKIIVVNDCSKDNTLKISRQLDCITLHLSSNLGIGGAVQSGLKYAFRNRFDYAVQIDGDGQHPAHELVKLIEKMKETQADIVIGSRFLEKKGFQSSLMRRFGINYFKKLIAFLCGITITDATSGFRLFNNRALLLANNYYPDEYPEPESIIYFHLNHLLIAETPVAMSERKTGKSSIGFFASVYYMLKVTLAVLFTYIKTKYSSPKKL